MDWETAAYIATIFQGILLPVSLAFVWYQLRTQSRLTQAANTQSLVELSSPFNLLLIQDRDFARLWIHGPREFATMDEVDQFRFRNLITWWMIFHENIYYQWEKKLIDETTYRAWDSDLRKFVPMVDLLRHWPDFRYVCQKNFVTYVETLIPEDERALVPKSG